MSSDITFVTDFRVVCPPGCTHKNCVLPSFAPNHAPKRTAVQTRMLHLHRLSLDKASNMVVRVAKTSDPTLSKVNDAIVVTDTRKAHCHVYVKESTRKGKSYKLRSYCAEPLCLDGRLKVRFLDQEEIDALRDGHGGDDDSDSSLGSTESITDEQCHELLDAQTTDHIASAPSHEPPASTPSQDPSVDPCTVCSRGDLEFAIESCGHLTRCISCALKNRTCPRCGKKLTRVPRNARK